MFEIQEKVQELAEDYVTNPVVKVRLMNFKFTVLGEVLNENTQTTLLPRVTLPEAIGLAGGLTELADRKNIKIIRQVNNEVKVFYVNLLDEDLIASPRYFVQQNDVIIVPPLKQRPFRRYFGQNLALFASTLSTLLLVVTLLLK